VEQNLKSKTNSDWPNIKIQYFKPVELYVDSLQNFSDNDNYKILWVKEVEEISNFKSKALNNSKKFDLILTYDEEILRTCNNSIMFEFGTSWIHNYDYSTKKKFQVSHLVGNKSLTYGHKLRKEIYYNQDKLKIPTDFYVSSFSPIQNTNNSKIIYDSKNELFESQFHICIENSKQKNLFTEKLIDCFLTGTVPIYWGCPGIGKFFNTDGMMIFDSMEEVHQFLEKANETDYNSRRAAIEQNFELAKQYYMSHWNYVYDFVESL